MTLLATLLLLLHASTCASFAVASVQSQLRGSIRRVQPPCAKVITTGEEIVPLTDHIVVDLQSIPSETQAGILLPTVFEDEQEDLAFVQPEPRAGTVLAVGPGALTKGGEHATMPKITKGQKVVVGPVGGVRIPLDGKSKQDCTVYLFKADDIWGVC